MYKPAKYITDRKINLEKRFAGQEQYRRCECQWQTLRKYGCRQRCDGWRNYYKMRVPCNSQGAK